MGGDPGGDLPPTKRGPEGSPKKTMNKNKFLYGLFGAIVVVAMLFVAPAVFADNSNGAGLFGAAKPQASGFSAAPEAAAAATATPLPPVFTDPGEVVDPAASSCVTLVYPMSVYLDKDGKTTAVHGSVADPSASSTCVVFNANTELLSSKADGWTTTIGGTPLKVEAGADGKWSIHTLNGAPIGPAVIFNLKAKADGIVGLDYPGADDVAKLIGPSWIQYAPVNKGDGTVTGTAQICYNYALDNPAAPKATLAVLDNTKLLVAEKFDHTSLLTENGTDLVTIKSPDGLAIGSGVSLCFGWEDPSAPIGTK